MNPRSCEHCGVIMDVNHMEPLPSHNDDGELIVENTLACYDARLEECVRCPVCGELVSTGVEVL